MPVEAVGAGAEATEVAKTEATVEVVSGSVP